MSGTIFVRQCHARTHSLQKGMYEQALLLGINGSVVSGRRNVFLVGYHVQQHRQMLAMRACTPEGSMASSSVFGT